MDHRAADYGRAWGNGGYMGTFSVLFERSDAEHRVKHIIANGTGLRHCPAYSLERVDRERAHTRSTDSE